MISDSSAANAVSAGAPPTPEAPPAREELPTPEEGQRTGSRTATLLRRHWIIGGLLLIGLGLRVVTQIAYRPALFYIDSFKYLTGTNGYDPEGYRFFLTPILWVGNLAVIPILQHVLGLAMGLASYVVLVRRGAPRWAAALAAAPILLDAYQLQMEQTIMPDVLFEALIVGGLAILLWNPRPGLARILIGAFVLGLAADVRQVGEMLIIPVAVFAVLAGRRGWRRAGYLGLAVVCCAVPMLTYMTISGATGNGFRLASRGTDVLYGRATMVADCATLKLPKYEAPLCPTQAEAAWGVDRLVNDADGPYGAYRPPAGKTRDQVVGNFVRRVEIHQPLAIPLSVLRDAVRLFALTRDGVSTITPISRWQFQPAYATFPPGVTLPFVAQQGQHYGGGGPKTIPPLATFLRDYQLHGGYTPGPLLAVLTALGAVGSLLIFGRRRRRQPPIPQSQIEPQTATNDERRLAVGTVLVTLAAVAVVLISDVYEYSWRYQLPALVTLPLAGVLGGTLIAHRLRARRETALVLAGG